VGETEGGAKERRVGSNARTVPTEKRRGCGGRVQQALVLASAMGEGERSGV
jgi:hypothetical protein